MTTMTNTTRQLVISDIAARTIQKWADALEIGEIELWQLPRPLADLFNLGYYAGRDSHERRIANLEHECDRLYLYAFNPKERAEIIQQRLDQHFRDEWERPLAAHAPKEVA